MFKLSIIFITLIVVANFANSAPPFEREDIVNNIHILKGSGGNIGVITGDDGTVLIDNGLARDSEALVKTLKESTGLPVYVLNTHWHYDHTGSNEVLADSTIITHHNVRKRLGEKQSGAALPDITYSSHLELYVNGFGLTIVHPGAGHTDGDSIVYINPVNVVHMGDQLFAGYFPYVDARSGGSLEGYMNNIKQVINQIDDNTVVIPGHGKVTNKQGLEDYVEMMRETIAIVTNYKSKGLSMEQSVKEGLPEKWEPWGNFFIKESQWIETVYQLTP